MSLPLRVLVVEDNPDDAELMVLRLVEEGFQPQWRLVENEPDYLAALEPPPELILADWNLPRFSGLRALQLLRQRGLDIPFIIVSGSIGEEAAVDALRQGAYDYVLKDRPGRLGQAVYHALEDKRQRLERQRAEEERARLEAELRDQARQMHQILVTVPAGVLLLDAEGRVRQANPVARNHLALLAGATVGDVITHLGDRPLAEVLTSPAMGSWHEIKAHGRTFEIIARPVENGPEPEQWVLVINDVTKEREFQSQLQQQAQLAAVGQLAAGIAHDFNNIMTIITLNTQMVMKAPGLSPKDQERLAMIAEQARRASHLVNQILDFSRRSVLERHPINLAPFLKELVQLLQRTLPEHIQIQLTYGQDVYTVYADLTRIQQAIMNLALNARDAMPQGGRLHIALERIQVSNAKTAPVPGMESGEWIRLTVEDTGTGIPPDVLPHIFEPFFTTKAPGQGSGLGLAQVWGIVGQHGGHVDVTTQVGKGTRFAIYLPAMSRAAQPTTRLAATAEIEGQGETILAVEDDPTTCAVLKESLTLLNYRVWVARNGREALALVEQHADEIDLVLSDVVMPEMGGIALFRALKEKHPALKVVLMTGHPMEDELRELDMEGLSAWLPKPVTLEKVAAVLARVLNKAQIDPPGIDRG